MSNNPVQIVKDFFAAIGRGDKQGLLAFVCRRYGVDHSGRGLAVGRHLPRTRGIGGFASEVRDAGNLNRVPRIRGAGRPSRRPDRSAYGTGASYIFCALSRIGLISL